MSARNLVDEWLEFERTCLSDVPPDQIGEFRTAFFVGATAGASRGARAARSGNRLELLEICAELMAGGSMDDAQRFAESAMGGPRRRLDG